jgi:cation diffusion facilitator CzcD-associated flavoprotein CzcO
VSTDCSTDYDVVVVGAGFSGMYQLHRLREVGFRVRVFDAATEVGGTWYWNRYPGARVDIESTHYSYSFDEELQQEWDWSERYAAQPEILAYARHVADRFDLRRDIAFSTRVEGLDWDETTQTWTVRTSPATAQGVQGAPGAPAEEIPHGGGQTWTARFVVLATGCLSVPQRPQFPGMEDFAGELCYTSDWPHDGVDLTGRRVAVIGTGSSGIQTITAIAEQTAALEVFQRTPNFAIPAHNRTLTDEERAAVKRDYAQIRAADRASGLGFATYDGTTPLTDHSAEEVERELDARWARGGLGYSRAFTDVMTNAESNEVLAEYAREQIRTRVDDPELAELLSPRSYPLASKRMCVDTGYFEVYNLPHVHLHDASTHPVERFTETGLRAGGEDFEVDVIVLATGFDAMTGAITQIDITAGGLSLAQKWEHGPRTYLGLMTAGFPNLLTVTGPQSPSVLTNMLVSIEFHVDWITRLLTTMRERGLTRVEARPEAEDDWVQVNNDIAGASLMPQGASWYMGANIPGKERVFMPFAGGSHTYIGLVEGFTAANHHGFRFADGSGEQVPVRAA